MNFLQLKPHLTRGITIVLKNDKNFVMLWFSKQSRKFYLELDGEIILNTPNFMSIAIQLETIGKLKVESDVNVSTTFIGLGNCSTFQIR
jgi:hypothetical protein